MDALETDDQTGDTPVHILIIDSYPASLLRSCRELFPAVRYRFEAVRTGSSALDRIASDKPDLILLDAQLSDRCGLALQDQIRQIAAQTPIILTASDLSAGIAIQAMKQGAYDCLSKPIDARQLQRAVEEAIRISSAKDQPVSERAASSVAEESGMLMGNSSAMRIVYKSIGLVAAQDVNVLITGESGTGKELVARAIHQHSARSDRPFLALNCAAIPENLLESELFGHEKGAFSGADRRRIGKFEQCNGGTILLDEIGDMPITLQAKILRLLQEQTFERVGGNQTIRTNVRLIASTHRDLKAWSAEERFRADLYYRLSVFTIHLPPLRERGEDLQTLIRHFLIRFSRELGRDVIGIAPDAMEQLRRYAWPGNIRELQSVMKQALLRASGNMLLAEFLPALCSEAPQAPRKSVPSDGNFDIKAFLRDRLAPDARELYAELHREVDRHSLAEVLTYTHGNQHVASRVLGIARQTLRTKLRESGLRVTQLVHREI
jgi:two-component system nitrogen regulation response regulator GlnG